MRFSIIHVIKTSKNPCRNPEDFLGGVMIIPARNNIIAKLYQLRKKRPAISSAANRKYMAIFFMAVQ
jgi:hypothetical protein